VFSDRVFIEVILLHALTPHFANLTIVIDRGFLATVATSRTPNLSLLTLMIFALILT